MALDDNLLDDGTEIPPEVMAAAKTGQPFVATMEPGKPVSMRKPVTDPGLLAELDKPVRKPVTDAALLAMLDGKPAEAPKTPKPSAAEAFSHGEFDTGATPGEVVSMSGSVMDGFRPSQSTPAVESRAPVRPEVRAAIQDAVSKSKLGDTTLTKRDDFIGQVARDEMARQQAMPQVRVADKPLQPKATLDDRLNDARLTATKALIGVPEAAVGLTDLAASGLAGMRGDVGYEGGAIARLAEAAGFRPGEAKQILDASYSDAQKAENAAVQNAEGVTGKIAAALENPSVIANTLIESAPQMGMGGILGRASGLRSPLAAGAAGEGIAGAGSAQESIRQQSGGTTSPAQSLAAALSGAGTAAFGAAGARLSQKLGIGDVDTMLVAGSRQVPVASHQNVVARVLAGGISEGAFEELPQSVQEQIWQNAALGRPLSEGVQDAVALGLLAGGVMGAGAGAISRSSPPTSKALAAIDKFAGTKLAEVSRETQSPDPAPAPAAPIPTPGLQPEAPSGSAESVGLSDADPSPAPQPAGAAQAEVVIRSDGKPFATAEQAWLAMKNRGLAGYSIEPAEGGGFQLQAPIPQSAEIPPSQDNPNENKADRPAAQPQVPSVAPVDQAARPQNVPQAPIPQQSAQREPVPGAQGSGGVAATAGTPLAQVGRTPKNTEPLTLRAVDGGMGLFQGDFPVLDYDSAEPVVFTKGETPAQVLDFIKANKKNLFGTSFKIFEQSSPANAPSFPVSDQSSATFEDFTTSKGEIKTFKTEHAAKVFKQAKSNKVPKGYVPRETPDGWVLSKQKKPRSAKQLANDKRLSRLRTEVDPSQDNLWTAIAKLGGINLEAIQSEWGTDRKDFSRIQPVVGKPVIRTKPGEGMSLAEMAERIAELGYIETDADGKFDLTAFEEAFGNGDSHYTPQGFMNLAERNAALQAEAEARNLPPEAAEVVQENEDTDPVSALDIGDTVADDDNFGVETSEADFLRAMGLTEDEINAEINNREGQADRGEAAAGAENPDTEGRVQGGATGEAGQKRQVSDTSPKPVAETPKSEQVKETLPSEPAGKDAENTPDNLRTTGVAKPPAESASNPIQVAAQALRTAADTIEQALSPSLELTGETESEIRAREERERAARDEQEKAKRDAEAKDRADREAKELRSRQGIAADNFTLDATTSAADQKAQDEKRALEQFAGQGGLFDSTDRVDSKGDAVENFGESLPPARRVLAAKLNQELSNDDVARLPLSQIWPTAENEAIQDPFAAAVAHAARAEIKAKPRQSYKVKRWVEQVQKLRGLAGSIVGGEVTKERMAELIRTTQTGLRDWWSKVQLLEKLDRSVWSRIGDIAERPEAYRYVDGKKVASPLVMVTVDGRSQSIDGNGNVLEHLDAIRAMLDKQAPEKRMEFDIRQRRANGEIFINKKGDGEYRPLMTFKTVEEARAAIKDKYADLVAAWEGVKNRDNITERDLRTAENRPRTGKDYRKGKDVTAEQFAETFGFRGGEFGKWVAQGSGAQERQAMLNSAYDGLMDLADIVGIPPKAISLNGTLGIAFGSRGSGWASAHFEPSNLVINLTKTRGAGALAHEWFHALDNYFSRLRGGERPFTGDNDLYRRENYITYKPERLMVHKDHPSHPLTAAKLRQMRESNPRSRFYAEENWIPDPKHPDGVRPEVEKKWAELVDALNNSPMAKRARTLDGKKTGEGYWSRIIEVGARSFENYVMSKMMERGYHNDFLANVIPPDLVNRNPARYPYLLPEEVAPIADAFDQLFSTIETKEDESGNVAMFSRTTSRVTRALKVLAENDDLFQNPVSDKKDMAGIVADVRPDFSVKQFEAQQLRPGVVRSWTITLPRPGTRAVVREYSDGTIDLNAAAIGRGNGGSTVYHIVANYAHNNGLKFKGDLDGLSDNALYRRTENMLASALKFGTTRHLLPHPRQLQGDKGLKVPPLAWDKDNDEANLKSLIDTSVANVTNQYPFLESVVYDFGSQQFVDQKNGRVLQRADFETAANSEGGVRAARAGGTTLERVALLRTLAREESGEGWGRLLASALRQSGDGLDPRLQRLFYSRISTPARASGLSVSEFNAILADTFGKKVAERLGSILEPIPTQADIADRFPNVAKAMREGDTIFGFYDPRTDKTYTILENIHKDMVKGLVLHEVGVHYGWREMLGEQKYRDTLSQLDVMVKAGNKQAVEARRTAEREAANPSQVREETLAYLVQANPEMTFVQRIISQIKAFLFRKFGLPASFLDANDFTVLAHAAVRHATGAVTITGSNLAPAFQRAQDDVRVEKLAFPLPDGRQYAVIKKGRNGNEQSYYATEREANDAADRERSIGRLEANRSAGRFAGWWVEDQAESAGPVRIGRLDAVARAAALRTTLDARSNSVNSAAAGRSLAQIPSRAGFCFKCAAEASANGVGDMVIGVSEIDGQPGWHAVVMRDGEIYDPTFGRWFAPGVYEELGFRARHSMTPEQVQDYLQETGGMAPDAQNQGLGEAKFSRSGGKSQKTARESAFEKAGIRPDRRNMVTRWADSITDSVRSQTSGVFGFRDVLAQGLADRFHAIKAAEKSVGDIKAEDSGYVAARLSTGLPTIMRGIMLYGAPEWKDGIIQRKPDSKGLLQIFEPVKGDFDAWIGWMVGKRAERLMAEGKEHNLTKEDIAELTKITPEQQKTFSATAVEFARFKRTILDLAEGAGLLDASTRPMWDQADWIPFYRVMETGEVKGPGSKRGLSGQSANIRTLKGGASALNDPMENILLNFSHLIDASLKNRALDRTLQNLAGGDFYTKEPLKMGQAVVPLSQVKKLLIEQGVAEDVVNSMPPAALQGVAKMMSIEAPRDPEVVRVMRNGKAEYFRVQDPMLLRALTNINQGAFGPNFVMAPLRAFKKILTRGVTITPDFMARNFVRDMQSAWLISKDGFRPGIDSVRGAWKSLKEEGGMLDMMFAGGSFLGGYVNGNDPKAMAEATRAALRAKGWNAASINDFMSTVVDTPMKLLEAWERVGGAVENANREAIFEAAEKAGKSKAAAVFEAKDLMDYSMQGEWAIMRFLADSLPFFNARVQGLYKTGRAFTEGNPQAKSEIAKKFGMQVVTRGLMITAATIALLAMNDGEDWYEELEDWDRDTYWHFKIGGHHFRIPKGFEMGTIFGTLPERAYRQFTGTDEAKQGMQAAGRALFDTFAFNPIPQIARPAVEVWANKSMFTGRPIEGMADQGKLPEGRYNERTSATTRAVAKAVPSVVNATGASPKRMEHLVRGYFGELGAYGLALSDLAVRAIQGAPDRPEARIDDYPLLKSFYRDDPPRNTRWRTELWEMHKEAQDVYRAVNAYRKDGNAEMAQALIKREIVPLQRRALLDNATDTVSALTKQIDIIMRDRVMTPEQKRKRIDELTARQNQVAKQAVQRAKAIRPPAQETSRSGP